MLIREQSQRQRRAAFTLMEMLVVVAIIVALAGIGGFFLLGQMGEAKEDIALTQARGALTTATQAYYLKRGSWPESLRVLLTKDQFGGPYLESADALKDPWGNEYKYDVNGPNNNNTKPDIWAEVPNTGKRIGNWPQIKLTN